MLRTMIIAKTISELADYSINRIAVACGNFDGLHQGHRSIIQQLKDSALASHAEPVILTFTPHPRTVLFGHKIPKINTPEKQAELLEELGIKAWVRLEFSKELAALEAEDFIKTHFVDSKVQISDFCVGSQWRFGAGRKGDIKLLESLKLFKIHPVQELISTSTKDKFSSSHIRQKLQNGDFKEAETMLSRPYRLRGHVKKGLGLATEKLKYATANLNLEEEHLPLMGVIAIRARIFEDNVAGPWMDAICNIGYAPTFKEKEGHGLTLEIHFFDFQRDLYGKDIEVEFIKKIRDEEKFDSIDLLKQQIIKDEKSAREILINYKNNL